MIYLGADHAGFELKEEIKKYLTELGLDYQDLGNQTLDPEDNYPDYAIAVAKKVAQTEEDKGVLICGSGVGMCIVANKIKGIRAVNSTDQVVAQKSRLDNNTNVLCLGGRLLEKDQAKAILKTWLTTDYSHEPRHERRLNKLKEIEG